MNIETIIKYIDKMDITTMIAMSIFCVIMDIVTGYLKAFKLKKVNSSISRDGFIKKLTWPISILIGVAFQYFLQINLVLYMSVAVCCVTEMVSVLENLCELNDKFNVFRKYLDKENKKVK